MTILHAFTEYPDEAALIGRILAGYTDLEIVLMHCVKAVRGDLDLALKTMFSGRGNSLRIDLAVAVARRSYGDLELLSDFDTAISAVRYCLKIRNKYAHCIWWNDNSGELAYANLEELAKQNEVVTELRGMTPNHVNIAHLQLQFDYFEYADNMLLGVLQEGNRRAGRLDHPAVLIPPPAARPPLKL